MSNIRESIVFSVEIDQWAARSADGFKGRVQAIRMSCHGKPLLFEKVADAIVGPVLLICKFGMCPDLLLSISFLLCVQCSLDMTSLTSRFSSRKDDCSEPTAVSTAALTASMSCAKIAIVCTGSSNL